MSSLNFVRKLTNDEQVLYSGALTKAIELVPAFRDGLALMRPFYDSTCATAYTDRYSRVGLSEWFFVELSNIQRSTVLLHECMHVLNNHFIRSEAVASDPTDMLLNVAQDFEINCGLSKLRHTNFEKGGIFPQDEPYHFEEYKTFEQYYHLLKDFHKDDPKDNSSDASSGDGGGEGNPADSASDSSNEGGEGGSGSSDGDSSSNNDSGSSSNDVTDPTDPANNSDNNSAGGCDNASEDRSAAADAADIARASDSEQQIAKKNTAARIIEERNKPKNNPGSAEMHDFLELAQRQMNPPKVSWQSIFRRVISRSNDAVMRGKSDYSYKRVNRRAHDTEYIFPGMVQYVPKIMFGIDTSGSMSQSDYLALLSEAEGIMKSSSKQRNGLKVFSVDVSIKKVAPVKSVKEINLQGGGGTDMSVAWAYVNSLKVKERPDVFILATDGGTNWASVENQLLLADKSYKSIILVTSKVGYESVPESVRRLAAVIDVSDD